MRHEQPPEEKENVTMALTRKLLKSLGLEEAAIDTIIDAHTETTDALKKQRDDAIAEAGTVEAITKERDQLKQQVETLTKQGGDAAKVQADFDAYKQQVEGEKLNAATDAALYDLAKKAGIQRESFLKLAVKNFNRDAIKRGDGNSISNGDELVEAFKAEFPDFLATEPSPTPIPPNNPPPGPVKTYTKEQIKGMSAEEINKNWDAVKNALASN
jgi:hypothetical protein